MVGKISDFSSLSLDEDTDEEIELCDKIDSDFAQDLDTIFEALPKERFVDCRPTAL